ncbi:MAG: Ldh family oxidoreductase [Chloroflexota bacterium]
MINVDVEKLRKFSLDIFRAAGASQANADGVVSSLISANLAGHDSHGVLRIPYYVSEIQNGRLNATATPRIVKETPSTAVIDGVATFGQIGARMSADVAVAKARQTGVASVAAMHCHHTGRIGEWVERVAAAGMVGMASTAGPRGPYSVAPFGGAQGALGTNPIAFAMPRSGGQPPILLDYATSAVAQGKLQVARAKGAPVPEGAIVDKDGNPTTDVERYFDGGLLQPFAGHKGYAMGVIVELLAVGLSGGEMVAPSERGSCFSITAINPTAFREEGEFQDYTDSVATRMKETRPSPGFSEVLAPGEPEARTREERTRDGIPLAERTWDELCATASKLGVAAPALP